MSRPFSIEARDIGWIVGLVLVILLAAALFLSAAARFNENDFMYAAAPAIFGGTRLYTDLPFLQAPLSIHLFRGVFLLTGQEYFYVSLRLLSMAFVAGSSFFVYLIARKLGGKLAALFAVIFFYCSFCIGYTSMEVGNYSLALVLILASIYVVLCMEWTPKNLAIVGLLIGMAAAARVNSALFSVPILFFVVCRFGVLSRETAAYVIAGILGSSMLLYYAFYDFAAFRFYNFDYHLMMNEFRKVDPDIDFRFALPSIWFWLGMAVPQFLLAGLSVWAIRDRHHTFDLLTLTVLIGTAFAVAASPGLLRPQYLIVMSALLCVMTGVALGRISTSRRVFQWVAYPVATVVLYFAVIQHVQYNLIFGFDNIAGGRIALVEFQRLVHRVDRLTERSDFGRRCSGSAISLSPLPILDAPFEFSRYSATGPFLPTVARQVQAKAPDFTHVVDLKTEIGRRPPDAILTGYFPGAEAEKRLEAYALENDFLRVDLGRFDRADNMVLYLRRSCLAAGQFARGRGMGPG